MWIAVQHISPAMRCHICGSKPRLRGHRAAHRSRVAIVCEELRRGFADHLLFFGEGKFHGDSC
jgi:hypothetical protein